MYYGTYSTDIIETRLPAVIKRCRSAGRACARGSFGTLIKLFIVLKLPNKSGDRDAVDHKKRKIRERLRLEVPG